MLASGRPITGLDGARLSKTGGLSGGTRPQAGGSSNLARLRTSRGRQQVLAAASDPSAEQLRLENERLRQELAARLQSMSPEKRAALLEQHNKLRASAKAAGVEIPALAAEAAEVESKGSAVATKTIERPVEPANKVAEHNGAKNGAKNGAAASSGSVRNGAAAGQPGSTAAGGSSGGLAAAVSKPTTLTFGSAIGSTTPAAAPAPARAAAPQTPTQPPKLASAPAAAASHTPTPKPATAAAAAPAAPVQRSAPVVAKAPAPPPPPPPPPKPVRDFKADREAANKEVAEHNPGVLSKGRESWLYFTVPEKPVAGADCVVYFNRWQSEPLRHVGRLQLHAKYNTWEVAAPEGDRIDMPHEGRINRAEGTDYYSCRVRIPEEAYELNFVVSNGDGVFDNNGGQNFLVPVTGPMTRDMWLDTAPERAEAAWRIQQEEEKRKAAEAAAAELAAKEAEDNRKADEAVAEIKREVANWQQGAAKQEAGRWRMVPALAQPGGVVRIQYNRLSGPMGFHIPEDQNLVLRVGHNNWKTPVEFKMKRSATPAPSVAPTPTAAATAEAEPETKEEWWEALVTVPEDATVLNFVVTYFEHCDNNNRQDFKALIDLPSKLTIDAWADSLRANIKAAITRKRLEEEAAAAAVEAERKAKRRAAQAKAEAVRRKQMKHVLFTVPEVPQAGEEITVFYNPNNGALPGRQKIWIKGGWNRWRHPRGFGPLEMTPPTEGDHFQATVTVPKDAYYLDFVFTDAPEHGEYDSNGGLDFHIPVKGSLVEEPPLHVVHVAVEMAPICKVGGLGDVVTSLGRAVQDQGHQVEVILPRYDFFMQSPLLGGTKYETEFDWGGTRIFVSTCVVEGLRCFFIEPRNGMFSGSVYQGLPDGERFDFFCRAALEFLLRTGRQPDILHCHDWSTADVAKAYWAEYHQYGLWKPRVVFTIHNMDFGQIKLGEAAFYSQRFTTVSPSYAWEIGGHPGIAPNAAKLRGVRNGIDIDIWDPETDPFLPRGYTAETVVEGKKAAREALRRRLNMNGWGDKPLVGVVSRLTKQKGTHLIAHSCFRTLDRGGQFVLLGSAPDPKIQAEFDGLANTYGGENAGFCFAFDEPLSHLIYAACDIILVPSMFEPCGLTQMIAMRYGAVPVVRATGGLKDTIFDVDIDKPRAAWEMEGSTDWLADGVDETNGFSFEGTDAGALDYALNRALDAYYNDRNWFHSLQKRVMLQDWSWNKPAHDYIELYYAALK